MGVVTSSTSSRNSRALLHVQRPRPQILGVLPLAGRAPLVARLERVEDELGRRRALGGDGRGRGAGLLLLEPLALGVVRAAPHAAEGRMRHAQQAGQHAAVALGHPPLGFGPVPRAGGGEDVPLGRPGDVVVPERGR